ncbi:MAG: sulfurtransferase TusA family protein [Pseudomonadota bacterium]
MEWDEDIDAVGLLCPLPVLRAAKRLRVMAPGQVLRLQADDPAAVVDVPHYCTESGNVFLGQTSEGAVPAFFIRKKA